MKERNQYVAEKVDLKLDTEGTKNIVLVIDDGEEIREYSLVRCQALWLADGLKLGSKFTKNLVNS